MKIFDKIRDRRLKRHVLRIAYHRGLSANVYGTKEELSVRGYAIAWEKGFIRRNGK
jgi:hypothetical protein